MNWLVENWYVVVGCLGLLTCMGVGVYLFINEPTDKKLKNLKEWLKWAVVEAEKALGSGTGQLKLRMVYDMAISKFGWLKNIVTFETFSKWVDEALIWMDKQLASNPIVKSMVIEEKKDKEE